MQTTVETTAWFDTDAGRSDLDAPVRYERTATYSMDSARAPSVDVIDAIVDVVEPTDGQTTLTLYEYLDPDGFNAVLTASTDKKSHVEVRFTVEGYLVAVRSDDTIVVYEPQRT